MSNTRENQIDKASPTDLFDQLRVLAPALVSALKANLPVAARSADITGIPVSSDTTGPLGNASERTGVAGEVLAVNATAGGSTGAKTIVAVAPAAGQVQVTYDANGIPTLTFAAADAVTECEVVMNAVPAAFKALLAEEAGS